MAIHATGCLEHDVEHRGSGRSGTYGPSEAPIAIIVDGTETNPRTGSGGYAD